MALFHLQYLLTPTAPFGLPDGAKLVLPSGPQEIYTATIHTKSGAISGHGTLPKYRNDTDALSGSFGDGVPSLTMQDNFATLVVASESAQGAFAIGQPLIERLCHGLSIQTGQRFSAELQFIEDEAGNASVPKSAQVTLLGTTSTYDIPHLRGQFQVSFEWARLADEKLDKALFYAEHAFMLNEFAQVQGVFSRQAAFSRGLAFLQLFKALGVIVGEKGVDRDYQRRFRVLGLPATFWTDRVEPLYTVRNDEDVAHYSLEPVDPAKFSSDFGKALAVLREAIGAYVHTTGQNHRSVPPDA